MGARADAPTERVPHIPGGHEEADHVAGGRLAAWRGEPLTVLVGMLRVAHEDPGAACELDPGVDLALAFRGRPGMATLEGPLADDLARGLLLQGSGHDLAHRREKKRRIGLIDHAVAVRVETICPLVDHDLVERSQEGIRKGELQDGHHADRNCRVADGVPEALACDGGHERAEKVGAQPVAEVAIVLCVGIADAPTERAHGPEVGARLLGPSPVAQADGKGKEQSGRHEHDCPCEGEHSRGQKEDSERNQATPEGPVSFDPCQRFVAGAEPHSVHLAAKHR